MAVAADPWSVFAGQLGGGLGQGLGAAIGGGAPAGPMVSGAPVDARSFMDGSGWTVSTGKSTATGGKSGGGSQDATTTPAPSSGGTLGSYSTSIDGTVQQAGMNPTLMYLLLGGVVLWAILG